MKISYKPVLGRSLLLAMTFMAVTAFACATCATHLYAHTIAPVIGVPDIGWDSTGDAKPPGPVNGITTFTPGGTPGTGVLAMNANIVSFIPGAVVPPNPMIGGTISIYAALTSVTPGAAFVHADFGTMVGSGFTNPNTYDVEIKDSTGALALAGNFGDLAINGIYGTNIGSDGAIFTPTAGYLLPDFPVDVGMVHLEFNAVPNWSATSFNNPWSSESKGDFGPVPEPGTIALLGTGFIGLLGYTRKRFWKKSKKIIFKQD